MAETKEKKNANVYEKVFNIQQAIHTVIKGGYNDHFKYKFARERDVTAEVKPLLGKEGLVITQSLVKEEQVGELTKITLEFRITNIKDPSDFIVAQGIGYGKDGQDKGAPKAYTMAVKYFLSKEFLVETGDDAEQEKSKGSAKAPAGAADDKFETALRMIQQSRNLDGLLEYRENLATSKTFNVTQKKSLQTALVKRIGELEPAE